MIFKLHTDSGLTVRLDKLSQDDLFVSPTKGILKLSDLSSEVASFVNEDREKKYSVIVGTDSEQRNGSAEFVSVVVVHRIGSHGRYFWHKINGIKTFSLRDRIYKEAEFSLNLAQLLIGELKEKIEHPHYGFEIHVDVGENGPTKEMIKEVVGMIKGNGFEAKIKPESWGATKVADKHV